MSPVKIIPQKKWTEISVPEELVSQYIMKLNDREQVKDKGWSLHQQKNKIIYDTE